LIPVTIPLLTPIDVINGLLTLHVPPPELIKAVVAPVQTVAPDGVVGAGVGFTVTVREPVTGAPHA
jgi:hypothetical protein